MLVLVLVLGLVVLVVVMEEVEEEVEEEEDGEVFFGGIFAGGPIDMTFSGTVAET